MTDTEIIEQGDKLILPTGSDPAVKAAVGYRRYYVGLDLGQAQDPSAISIIKDERLPVWSDVPYRQTLSERQRCVVWADRIKDTSYTAIARHAASLLGRAPLLKRSTLVVDATGVGRAFCDVLDEHQIDHMRVQMTGGMNATRAGRFWNVSKVILITALASAFETRSLTIAADLPLRSDLILELESFQVRYSAAGNQILDAGGAGHHADIAIATALALFASDNAPQPMEVGQLEGWY